MAKNCSVTGSLVKTSEKQIDKSCGGEIVKYKDLFKWDSLNNLSYT